MTDHRKMNEPWAAAPLSDGSIAAVEAIENAVRIELIATFEPQLVFCSKTDTIAGLLTDCNYAPFDYLPVRSDERMSACCRSASFLLRRLMPG
jgi:hypothetical protein